MNDFFGFMGLLVSIILYGLVLVPVLLLALAIPYAVLHYRNQNSEEQDPQVGIKAGLYFFYSTAILLALNGLTVIVVDAMVKPVPPPARGPGFGPAPAPAPAPAGWNEAQRVGGAIITVGVVFAVLHLVFIKALTNDNRWPATRRVFAGWRFAVHGLVVLVAFTALTIVLFQKDFGEDNVRKTFFATLLVWTPSWLLHLVLLRFYSQDQTATFPPNRPRSRPSDRDDDD